MLARHTVRRSHRYGDCRNPAATLSDMDPLGAAITGRMFERGWLRRGRYRRVVHLTDVGRDGLASTFGIPVGRFPG